MIDNKLTWLATTRHLFYSMCAAHATAQASTLLDQVPARHDSQVYASQHGAVRVPTRSASDVDDELDWACVRIIFWYECVVCMGARTCDMAGAVPDGYLSAPHDIFTTFEAIAAVSRGH